MEEKFNADALLLKAKNTVVNWHQMTIGSKEDGNFLTEDEVYIVWFCKTLQNWKAILSTTEHDGRIYEVTFNGDRDEKYIDVYTKEANECFRDIR